MESNMSLMRGTFGAVGALVSVDSAEAADEPVFCWTSDIIKSISN